MAQDILSMIQQFTAGTNASMASNTKASKDAGTQEELLTEQLANASKALDTHKADVALREQVATRIQAANIGADISQGNEIISQLTQSVRENTLGMLQQQKKIQEMDAVTFTDSPLQYLQNLFTINDEIDKHNTYESNAGESAAAINAINNNMSSIAQLNHTTAEAITRESIASELEVKSLAAQAGIAKLRQANISVDTHNLQALQQGKQQEVSNYYADQSLQMQLHSEARADANFKLSMEEHQFRVDQMKEIKDNTDYALEVYNKGAEVYGRPPANKQMLAMMDRNPELKAQSAPVWEAGMTAMANGSRNYGNDSADIAINLAKTGAVNTLRQLPMVKYLADKTQSALSTETVGAQKNAQLREDLVRTHINTAVANDVMKFSGNVEAKDSFYAAPSLDNIVKANPALQNTSIYKAFLGTMIQQGTTTVTADNIRAQLDTAISKGIITNKKLAFREVAQLFEAGMATNNVMHTFADFKVLPQTSYNVQKRGNGLNTSFGLFSKPAVFNIVKPEQFEKYFMYSKIQAVNPVNLIGETIMNKLTK